LHTIRSRILTASRDWTCGGTQRAWDSRRDWSAVADLELLRESSTNAVDLLRTSGNEARIDLSYALTAQANYTFKVACLYTEGEQTEALDAADCLITESIKVLASTRADDIAVPTLALGVAMLVGGVTATVRSQGLDAAGMSSIEETLAALNSFYAAETTIRQGVACPSELSIFTHGNIAETYFYALDEFCLGLFHFAKACEIAERVFGSDHINTKTKVRDLAQALGQLGQDEDAKLVREQGYTACPLDDIYTPGPIRFSLKQRGTFIDFLVCTRIATHTHRVNMLHFSPQAISKRVGRWDIEAILILLRVLTCWKSTS
jgi:hypothetical protein